MMTEFIDRRETHSKLIYSGALWIPAMICLMYIFCLLVLGHEFAFDRAISDRFYDFACQAKNARACWLLDKSDRSLTFFLHDLPVHIYTATGVAALLVTLGGFRRPELRKYRELGILTLIALVTVPGIVALLKIATGHFCPGQLPVYGGPVGMAGVYQPKARCFPAGFPAGGFGLVVLYFGALPLLWRRIALFGGLGLGVISSIIQIARGEHYLSHCLATLLTALFVGLLVSFLKNYDQGRYYAFISR